MCFTQTLFYYACQHYGLNAVVLHRCVRAEVLPSSSKGCEHAKPLGVMTKYECCPRCSKTSEASQTPIAPSPARSEVSGQSSNDDTSTITGDSEKAERKAFDCDRFNSLVKRHSEHFGTERNPYRFTVRPEIEVKDKDKKHDQSCDTGAPSDPSLHPLVDFNIFEQRRKRQNSTSDIHLLWTP